MDLIQSSFPAVFLERLERILGTELYHSHGLKSLECGKVISVRVNLLKTGINEIENTLAARGIAFRRLSWNPHALILENITIPELGQTGLLEKGFLYSQGLSSLLPALVLEPKPGERVLDMCAAPGSKTSQMAALMHNEGQIVAIDNIRGRFYKLKSVLNLLGVQNTAVRMLDARRYKDSQGFDKILLDAPCSSEGRFKFAEPKTYAYWSLHKIKEMVHKQRGLLLTASRLLKPGGVLVYSTCTFAPEENEGVLHWLLRKTSGTLKVEPIGLKEIESYPVVREWAATTFNPEVKNCLRVLPTLEMEGFFIAKIVKI